MEAARLPWRRLGALLLSRGLLYAEQLAEAFEEQGRTGRRFGEVVVERGWVQSADLAMALAEQYGLEFADLGEAEVDPEVGTLLPEHLARRYGAMPLRFLSEDLLLVGLSDPSNIAAADELRMALGTNVAFAVVDDADLGDAIKRVHRGGVEIEEEDDELEALAEAAREREEIWEAATSVPAVKLVNSALSLGIEDGASDIHFEPEEEHLCVRARVDGVMRELTTIPKAMQAGVLSRLKIVGGRNIAGRRAPQDGRVFVRFAGKPVDLRIAVLPTTHGERVVLRVLQRAAGQLALSELGMGEEAEAALVRATRQPYGAVIVCGPTGSGKTTTLYACLNLLNDRGRVVITIEDPVEYQIPGVSQIEVNPRSGPPFARGLRTILRSDPDALLVGEIRDEETARIAIQAAMTGHVVLTSLHTHNAASSIARLKDMGVEPSLLAASVNCIVAQRLARRLCVDCREAYEASPNELAEVGLVHDAGPVTLWRAGACGRCSRTGYRGRVALYEVMPVQGRLRGLVAASTEEIFAAAVDQGMKTLRQDGFRLCLAGVSSLDEIHRVTGDRLV
jgi:type IV pilus assembly protein PilB